MEVILLERIERLGQMGQVVKVRPGFARNYLLPQKKALRATKDNLAVFENQRSQLEAVNLKRKEEAQHVAGRMDGTSIVVIRQAGESGQLYGSVSGRDVALGLTEAGFTVDRAQVQIDSPIKSLGLFEVRVVLHPEVQLSVEVNVARSVDEAQLQKERGGMLTREAQEADEIAAEEEAARVAAEATAAAESAETGEASEA